MRARNYFLEVLGNTSAKGYKAHFKRANGDIGITAEYSKDILMLVIEEILEIDKGSKLLKVSAV